MLYISIIFYENDMRFLNHLVRDINNNVEIEHKIILADNRDDKTKKFNFDTKDIKIINMKGNKCQLWAKKEIVNSISDYNSYVWFIDADDGVKHISKYYSKYFDKGYDMIYFNNFVNIEEENIGESYEFIPKKMSIGTFSSDTMWNKFVKVEVLKKALIQIPYYKARFYEDSLLSYICFITSEKCVLINKNFYSYSSNHSIFKTDKKFLGMLTGIDKTLDLLFSIFKTDLRFTGGKPNDIVNALLYYSMFLAFSCETKECGYDFLNKMLLYMESITDMFYVYKSLCFFFLQLTDTSIFHKKLKIYSIEEYNSNYKIKMFLKYFIEKFVIPLKDTKYYSKIKEAKKIIDYYNYEVYN